MKALFNVYLLVCVVTIMLMPQRGHSQKNVDHQSQLWTRYSLSVSINEHWSATQDIEERTYWFPWRQHQFVSRTFGRYKFENGIGVGGGFAYFLQSLPQDPHLDINYTQPELRPEVELSYTHKVFDKLSMSHRYWNEWRYFKEENEDVTFGNIRMRYKLELQYKPVKSVTLRAFDELFVNFGKNITNNTFDQNRIGASIQYMPLKNVGLELGYINWYQQRPSGVDFYDRNIVRLTIHHKIDVTSANN